MEEEARSVKRKNTPHQYFTPGPLAGAERAELKTTRAFAALSLAL